MKAPSLGWTSSQNCRTMAWKTSSLPALMDWKASQIRSIPSSQRPTANYVSYTWCATQSGMCLGKTIRPSQPRWSEYTGQPLKRRPYWNLIVLGSIGMRSIRRSVEAGMRIEKTWIGCSATLMTSARRSIPPMRLSRSTLWSEKRSRNESCSRPMTQPKRWCI